MPDCRKCGEELPKVAKYCPSCGTPVTEPAEPAKLLAEAEKKKLEDAAVELVQSATSLVSGASKLVSVLGSVIEDKSREGRVSKDLHKALTSLGSAVKSAGDTVDQLSKKVASEAEKRIRE